MKILFSFGMIFQLLKTLIYILVQNFATVISHNETKKKEKRKEKK